MGQDLSKSLLPPPTTFQQCSVDDEFSLPRYILYRRNRDFEDQQFKHMMDILSSRRKRKFTDLSIENISSDSAASSTTSSFRSVKKHKLLVRADDGSVRALMPTDTLWYLLYVKTPPQDNRLKNFQNKI